jgi:secreted trypsin-like serine protease
MSALSLVGGVVALDQLVDGSKTFSITEVKIKDGYADGGHANDLAILVLNETVASPLIPILPSQDPIPAAMPVTILGWGATTPNGGVVKQLHSAAITALDDATCLEIYGAETFDEDQSFCANKEITDDEHSVDSCQGDTGGPVIFTKEEAGVPPVTYLGGVISWGYGKFNLSYRAKDRTI